MLPYVSCGLEIDADMKSCTFPMNLIFVVDIFDVFVC